MAELEYIVGRDQVDHALRTLVAVGAINLHKTTTAGARNLVTRIQYSINPDALNKIISGTPDFRSPGDSCPQEPPGQLQPVLKSGVPYMKKEKEKEKAAALAPECTPSAAVFAKKKRRVVRASGVVVWLLADEQEAERLEQTHDATAISTAVTVLRASGKEPVPGLVSREIERQQRERDTAARRAASDAKQAALAAAPPHELDFASLDYSKLPLRMCEQALRVASKNQ
ncbi:MAG: hypothetical protein EPO06_08700 [Burkholderiaceae bacterium]|nr:MAG: hypothetical protein EPO06_08700 [Burkholderiaceae bacterium]